MKIGFVLDDTLDSTDGVQQYILALGDALSKKGHEIHYLVGETQRTDIPNVHSLSKNLKVAFNKNRMSTPLPANTQKLKRLLRREKFDVLHVQMPYSPFLGGKLIRLAESHKIPTVATFHIMPATTLEENAIRMLGIIQKRTYKLLSTVLAVSDPAANCAREAFGREVKVISNPVDVKKYEPSKNQNKANQEQHIVFVGRLVSRKGCLELLHALSWLKRRNFLNGVKVTICGDGPELQNLKHYTGMHELTETVEFLGRVTEEVKIDQLRSATIAIYPSTGGESFGIVLIEAMAAGAMTVLAGDNPGYRFVMKDREQQLVNPRKTEIFAAQILHFLRDSKERKKSYAWQQKRVQDFSLDKISTQIETVYVEAIAKFKKD